MRALPVVLALTLLGGVAPQARGEIYAWTDERGGIHFTQRLTDVPPAQRRAALARALAPDPSRLQLHGEGRGGPERGARGGATLATGSPSVGRSAAHELPPGSALRIPFERHGTLMVVEAVLNDQLQAPFLIDTGASGVSIPDSVARRLGLRIDADTPRQLVQTAGGVVAEPAIQLDSIQVGLARVERVAALVNSSMEIGLLGGAFFNNFVYEVDAAASVITLRPNEGVRGGLSEAQWRGRFREARGEIERLERHLSRSGFVREARREELERNLESLRDGFDALQREANAAGVPQGWRE